MRVAGQLYSRTFGRQRSDPHQVLLDDQDAVILHLGREARVGLLRQHKQNVRTADIGVKDRLIGDDERGTRSAAARLRAVVLGHGGVTAVVDAGRFADDIGRQHHALASETGEPDLSYRHIVLCSNLPPSFSW